MIASCLFLGSLFSQTLSENQISDGRNVTSDVLLTYARMIDVVSNRTVELSEEENSLVRKKLENDLAQRLLTRVKKNKLKSQNDQQSYQYHLHGVSLEKILERVDQNAWVFVEIDFGRDCDHMCRYACELKLWRTELSNDDSFAPMDFGKCHLLQ